MSNWFRQPITTWPWRRRVVLAALAAAILLLCFMSEASGLTARLSAWSGVTDPRTLPLADEIQVHTLDVGNADATLIFCDGEAMLIDAGEHGDGDTITAYLQRYGVTHLTYVIETHTDADHIGGMREVLQTCSVGEYLTKSVSQTEDSATATYRNLISYLKEQNITVTEADVGTSRLLGEARITVLAPLVSTDDTNEQSLVCLIAYRDNRFLFMGDAGVLTEKTLLARDIDADFLKVGHHGGDDATSKAFLNRVTPSVAVISCGADNPYGHPDAAVVKRLADSGAAVYRTDRNGCIITVGDGNTLRVTAEET